MPKKTISEKFREFLQVSPTESNEPMTRGEIATVKAKKKSKGAAGKRAANTRSKKTAVKKTLKKKSTSAKRVKKGSKS